MKLYGGIDLHSNISVVALSDEDDGLVQTKVTVFAERPGRQG